MDFLSEIVCNKKKEVDNRKLKYPLSDIRKDILYLKKNALSFKDAISLPDKINLIAEIKHASPSRGIIRNPFDHKQIAGIYNSCKVSAVSVLTENKYFKGNLQYLKDIREITPIPLLMKDFIIDEYQIYEAKKFGASAILLIAAILTLDEIKYFINLADSLGLDCLTEIHNEEELEKVLKTDSEIIGINNRNLKTFNIDLAVSFKLKEKIPRGKITVSESGINSKDDLLKLKVSGFNAVLIGETFMKSPDIASKINEIWND